MDDQRSSVNFDSAAKWPFKLRGKHYLPAHNFSKSLFFAAQFSRHDLRLHQNQVLSCAVSASQMAGGEPVEVTGGGVGKHCVHLVPAHRTGVGHISSWEYKDEGGS